METEREFFRGVRGEGAEHRTRDLIGCRCHQGAPNKEGAASAHTFPWAKNQYPPERPLWPTAQSLDLVLDIEKQELSGSNTILFKVLHRETECFEFDAADLRIHDVQVNNKPARFSVGDQKTTVTLSEPLRRGETGELKISYTCHKPRAGLYFIGPDEKYPHRPVQVWSQGQDDDARFWFPSFDEPRIKCSLAMRIEVPAGYVATSNGSLHSESRGGKTWTFQWKSTAQIPSYLVTLSVGKFSEIKEDWRGKPVTYLVEKGREEEAKRSFGKTTQMMELFSKTIGVEYPWEKYAQIAASEFIFGGMENTSATTQTDATLHPAEVEEDFSSDDLVAHELAHQWFGDLVTCKTWSHGWLNEGWATFMETVFKEQDLGKDETHYYRFEELNIYLGEDHSLYRRPIVTNFYADPGEVWDRHIYQKGGLVLNMLRHEIGDEDFWSGTRHYLNAHKGGTVETVDFQRALEHTSGRNLQLFFDQWVYKGGYPELKASFEWDEKNKLAQFKLEQKQKVNELTPIFKFGSVAEFFFADGSSYRLALNVTQKEQAFYVPLKDKPAYVRFDAGNNLIKTIEWGVPTEMIRAQLEKDADVVGKIWAMKHLAKEATKEGLEALIDRLKKDSFWGVRAEAALALGEAKSEEGLIALMAALREEKSSKVRSKICSALGHYREEHVADLLIGTLAGDKSLFVRGAAALNLGKTKSKKAFDQLKAALNETTWNDILASNVYAGLRQLRDERALDLFMKGAAYGAPKYARLGATAALGEYGLNNREVTEFLEECLTDKYFRVRFMAADALAKRKDPGATQALEDAAYKINDGHFKAAAFRAARRLRQGLEKPAEFSELREGLSKISDENRKLRDRLAKLEQQPKK